MNPLKDPLYSYDETSAKTLQKSLQLLVMTFKLKAQRDLTMSSWSIVTQTLSVLWILYEHHFCLRVTIGERFCFYYNVHMSF